MPKMLKLSEGSVGWLTAALDPFHDYQYEVAGLPDERSAPSVVQIHNQTVALTAPTSAGGNPWDAAITFTGMNSVIDSPAGGGMSQQNWAQIHFTQGFSTGMPFGALNYWAGAAGTKCPIGATVAQNDKVGALGSVMSTDRCRLIGVAFEVHNTTAEVYRQGSLSVAQLPDSVTDAGTIKYTSGVDTTIPEYPEYDKHETIFQLDRALVQPQYVAALRAVPGSQTWPAADGCYCVPRMTEVPRDITLYREGPIGTWQAGSVVQTGVGHNGRVPVIYGSTGELATPEPTGMQQLILGDVIVSSYVVHAFAPNGFAPMQVFFSGLSTQTNLTISFRTIVEYFPAVTSPLLPLANPSPAFDPKALALYSAVVSRAPYAVPVNQNAAGEYFRKILKVLSMGMNIISPVFGPYAPVASVIGEAAGAWSRKLEKDAGPGAAQGKMSTERSKVVINKKSFRLKPRK